MTIEIALLISVVSVIFGIYSGIANLRRTAACDTKKDTSEMTTVIVKLESIGDGIAEIKAEIGTMKADVKELRDRLIVVEQSAKQAHKRMDALEIKPRQGNG